MRAIAAAFLFLTCSTACEAQPRVTGIFGDLTYNTEGGDLLGTEIHIAKTAGHYEADVQLAEGGPGPIQRVAVTVRGDHVHFVVPEEDGSRDEYDGRVTAAGFDGTQTFVSPSQRVTHPLHLPRLKKSYWQRAR